MPISIQDLEKTSSNSVIFEAELDNYDVLCRVSLKFDNNTFEVIDGDGQFIRSIFHGSFELQDDNKLILLYEKSEEPYHTEEVERYTPISYKKVITYTIKKEDKKHFDGYLMKVTNHTINFDVSPFDVDGNTFEILQMYHGITHEKCDVKYERMKQDEQRIKRHYCDLQPEGKNVSDHLKENSEDIRQINLEYLCNHAYQKWIIIKYIPEHELTVSCGNIIIEKINNDVRDSLKIYLESLIKTDGSYIFLKEVDMNTISKHIKSKNQKLTIELIENIREVVKWVNDNFEKFPVKN